MPRTLRWSKEGVLFLMSEVPLYGDRCHWKARRAILRGCNKFISQKVFEVFLQKSIPAQIRQLILYNYKNKERVDAFVRELNFAKRRYKYFM